MPMPVAAKAGVIAISVAVAAAIAVYESPELRRVAEDLRRRIAIALHSLGDNVHPPSRDPVFNRPEDAEGFLTSRGVVANDVDADDETRRHQREELMYWNALREEKKELERAAAAEPSPPRSSLSRGSTFDDFLEKDAASPESGAYIFNTGAEVARPDEGLVQRRRGGADGVRGINAAVYANPFADEHGVDDFDEMPDSAQDSHIISPDRDEIMSDDIYNATEPAASRTLSPVALPSIPDLLFDFDHDDRLGVPAAQQPAVEPTRSVLERELADDEYMTAGQDREENDEGRQDAYASIQAWAQSSNPGFYSPLPVSPAAPLSEPEIISDGVLTPTDSASVAESAEDIGDGLSSRQGGNGTRYYDVMSDDEDGGMATPVSWTEVGSVVSESESAAAHA